MKHTYSYKATDKTTILCIVIIAIAVAGFVLSIIAGVANSANRISEGVLVDKHYSPAYTTTTYTGSGNNRRAVPRYHSAKYRFTIEGEKNGETVRYTFDVTESEYDRYKVGDYYVR